MYSKIMRAVRFAIIATSAVLLQACSPANPYVVGPYPQDHPEHELDLTPMHVVCDRHGENCMACDANNQKCRKFMTPGIIAFDPSRKSLN